MIKYTLSEAVYSFGTEKQKQAFDKSGNLMVKQFNALIKEIERYYDSVKVEGRGSKRIIVCDGEREEIAPKKDNRKYNGANQLPYEYELNSLVLDYVLNNCKNKFVSMSLTQWLIRMELVDPRIVAAYNNENAIYKHLDMLKEKYEDRFNSKDIAMLMHFVELEVNRLRSNLASVFDKLAKHKIIIHIKEMYGCPLDGTEHRALTKSEIEHIGEKRRELCKKYSIPLSDFRRKIRMDNLPFKEEYVEFLRTMGFEYIYESHGCVVQVSDEIIKEYLDKLKNKNQLVFSYGLNRNNILKMMGDFKGNYTNHSLNLAEKRQANPTEKEHKRIKQLKAFGEYLSMWELLLIFYDLTNYIEPRIKVERVFDDGFGIIH